MSFFSGMGKATFMKYFFQHANFICGDTSLADVNLPDDSKSGLLAFFRLVGTVYMKEHSSGS